MDVLIVIKRLVMAGKLVITEKAQVEMLLDNLTEMDVIEAIVYSPRISKKIMSTSIHKENPGDRLYIIIGKTLSGKIIYTKGRVGRYANERVFYVLISSKRSMR